MARAEDTFFLGRGTELGLSLQTLQQRRKMSDEELEDFEPDQDDLEKEDDEKETEEWEDYRKEGEEYSEEVRAWKRWGAKCKGEGWARKGCLTSLPLAVDAHPPHGGHDEGRAFFAL